MNKLYLLIILQMIISSLAFSQAGDTLTVQTYTFEEQNNPNTDYDSPGRRWFQMPEDDGTEYQKILMYYTLKCFEDGTAGGLGFDCGEWDYTSHTFLYEHTGVLDSNALSHPQYLVNNMDFDSIPLSSFQVNNWVQNQFPQTVITSTMSETEFSLNSAITDTLKFEQGASGRFQWFYSADELAISGIDGLINKISIFNAGNYSELSNLKIKATHLDEAPLSLLNEGLEDLFYHPSEYVNSGQFDFLLDQGLEWDGESGLLFDFSFDSCGSDFHVLGGSGESFLINNNHDKYIIFDGGDQVHLPHEIFSSLENEVTIGYWLNGTEDFQPENGTTFEGVNADNERVLNSHNPWGNGQVYWDAGQDGGYDRINAQANEEDYAGGWNHWAFTKNTVTGEMKIFLNGEEWLSGQNKDNPMNGITRFNIGSAAGWENYYRGSMDDFFIIGKELSSEEIQLYMTEEYSEALPFADQLLGYFGFNHEYGELANNEVSDFNGVPLGNAQLELHQAEEAISEVNTDSFTPWFSLFSGEYETQSIIQGYATYDSTIPVSIVEYEVVNNTVEILDYEIMYPEDYMWMIDVNGNIFDSISNVDTTLYNSVLNYFSPEFEIVNRIELGRFITPYGIGLDLEEGWTWIYDVTDYEPLLHGQVELEAGNWQELLDLKFAYIEGTPTRDVKRVENIWAGNWQLSTWDEQVQEQTIQVSEGEEMFKVRATTSGHWFGQGNNCAEFCSNVHELKVDGSTEYSWEMMQECADNPLYPQGGTWVYDRAGWCPGAPVTTRELEVTPYVSGDEFNLEYDIDIDPYGNYWLMGQLISYGEMNFSNEVEISEILAPSDFRLNSRINPMCADPLVRIRNNGSETLTSCEFSFGINGEMETYTWAGSLAPLEYEDVALSYGVTEEIYNGDDEEVLTFEVSVANPNGVQDENDSNNYSKSNFVRPPTYGYDDDEDNNQIIVELRTNASPQETTVYLKNLDGSIHWTGNYSEANTLHRDILTLNAGCYQLHVLDSGDDGLDFFANNDGTGYVRLKKVGGWYFETFESNFGKELIHNFNFETDIYDNVTELKVPSFTVYPNPSEAVFYVQGINLAGEVDINVFDNQGRLVRSLLKSINSPSDRIALDLKEYPSGLYQVVLEYESDVFSRRVVKK